MEKKNDGSQNMSKDYVTLEELIDMGEEDFEKIQRDWSARAKINRERQTNEIEQRERARAAVPKIKLTATRKGDVSANFFHIVSLLPETAFFERSGVCISRTDLLMDAITEEIKMNLGAPDKLIGDDTPYALALEEVVRQLLVDRLRGKEKSQRAGEKKKNVEKRIVPPSELKAKTLELIGRGDIANQKDLETRLSHKFKRRNGDKTRPIDIHTRLEELKKKDEEVAAALDRLPIKETSKKRQ